MSDIADPFLASRTKLARARYHLAALEALSAEHIQNNPPVVRFQSNVGPDGQPQSAEMAVTFKGAPAEYGAIVGDIVHNLRAALDLMAVTLVGLEKGNTKGVYFPFCDSETDLGLMIKRRNFDRAGQQAVAVLEGLKPFKGGNIALRAIHDLDIQDKHHTLIPTSMLATSPVLRVRMESGQPVLELVEDSVADVRFTFPDDSPFAKREVAETLHELVQLVEGVIETFAAIPRGG